LAQNAWYGSAIAIRSAADPGALTAAVKQAIARVDKDQPVTRVRTMDEVASQAIAQPRFRAELVGSFAALALALAVVGVFGVLAFGVSQRTREFGIRMALGASGREVLRIVLAGGSRIVGAGIFVGLLGALALTQSLSALLFGVKALDPVTFIATPLLLAAVALIACALPAWRASRVDPAIALREE
jgi:putative ABC transport system permease protein